MKKASGGLPKMFTPMLASLLEEPFDSPDHLFEVKWDGVRTLAFCNDNSTRLFARSGREVSDQYPEFLDLHERLAIRNAVLDGEIVAMDSNGRPSFQRLQGRIGLSRPGDVRRGMAQIPLDLVLFDLVHVQGEWFGTRPLEERLEKLQASVTFSDPVLRSEPILKHGKALFAAAVEKGLEGIVAKKRGSHYIPGKRTREWLKIKNVHELSCVICGWSQGYGSRAAHFGSLLLAVYHEGELMFIGSVGTGFTESMLGRILERLKEIETDSPPFRDTSSLRNVHWVKPKLVCDVEYRELTNELRLRAPSFKGLRDDLSPQQCILET